MDAVTFAGNYIFIIGALMVFAGCGWWAVAPFSREVRYAALVAPLAGILVLTLATVAFYVIGIVAFDRAAVASLVLTLVVSLVLVIRRPPRVARRELLVGAGLLLGLAGVAVYFTTAASLRLGSTATLYMDGTDHVLYANVADWFRAHAVVNDPVADPLRPYMSWPNFMLENDPRAGSYAFLGLVSLASGHSGLFSFDLAVALVSAATVLATAAVFARSPLTMILLMAGLFMSHWFDYGRTGYLGKILGYPGAFVVAGLLMRTISRPMRPIALACLALLIVAVALMHSGFATALFLGLLGAAFLAWEALGRRRAGDVSPGVPTIDGLVWLGLLLGIAVTAAGTLARPLALGFPDWHLAWSYITPRLADLDSHGLPLTGLSTGFLTGLTWLNLALWLAAGIAAWRWRLPESAALFTGPLLLLLALWVLDARTVAVQVFGTFYPLGLCGLALMIDARRAPASESKPAGRALPVVMMVVALLIHLPHFAGAAARFGGRQTPPATVYSEAEMERLAALVGRNPVLVDLTPPQPPLALLAELGRRDADLQWSAASWRIVTGYRKWPLPQYSRVPKYRIVSPATVPASGEREIFRNAQYLLLEAAP